MESLNEALLKISDSRVFLSQLIDVDLYHIEKETAEIAKNEALNLVWNHQNTEDTKQITIVLTSDDIGNLKNGIADLLTKIFAAAKFDFNKTNLYSWDGLSKIDFSDINSTNSSIIYSFTGLHSFEDVNLLEYVPIVLNESTLVILDPISWISDNVEKKRKLWETMKTIHEL